MADDKLNGKLIGLNAKLRKALVEQAHNRRRFEFSLDVWEGDLKLMSPNLEVEFELSGKEVSAVRPKPRDAEDFTIHENRPPEACINDYFGATKNLIETNREEFENSRNINYTRIKRFLFTAYHDITEMDNSIITNKLSSIKSDLLKVDKDHEEFTKLISYTPEYNYEKIYLSRQVEYVKNEEMRNTTNSIVKNGQVQQASLGSALKKMEELFAQRKDRDSIAYQNAEINLKNFRRKYVDLLHYIAQQKERLVKLNEAGKKFSDEKYEPFLKTYIPLVRDLKADFMRLLNSRAYKLDENLWTSAKKSQVVRRFFKEAGITGTYSTKTFLKYYLRNLDETKINKSTKVLFDLLKYMEEQSKRNILVITNSAATTNKIKESILKFDKDMQVSTNNAPQLIIKPTSPMAMASNSQYDIIMIEWETKGINAVDFALKYNEVYPARFGKVTFAILLPNDIEKSQIQGVEELNIKNFAPLNDETEFIDMLRMML